MHYRLLNPTLEYDEITDSFEWFIGDRYNIAADIDRHAEAGDPLALIYDSADAPGVEEYWYSDLQELSNRLANAMREWGISRGDKVAVSLPQSPEFTILHLASYKLGAVVVPMTTMFGPDAYEYRLRNSEAKLLVTNGEKVGAITSIRDDVPSLKEVMLVDPGDNSGYRDFEEFFVTTSSTFDPVETEATDPAAIFYTSGTTGDPKGVVQSHQHVLGNHPGLKFFFNYPAKGERIWGPADWSWAGGYLALSIPPLTLGMTTIAYDGRFDPRGSMEFIERHDIQHAFLPPTALKQIIDMEDATEFDIGFRSIMSGGEPLAPEVLSWWEREYDIVINEMYGQTEADSLTGNCGINYDVKPGSIGKPIAGRTLEIIDDEGEVLPPGEVGEIAVKRPDPTLMLEYHGDPELTAERFTDDWYRTGDLGRKDEDGYFYFVSRKDDLIISAGYRISPVEVENTLIEHEAVAECAVIGVDDDERGKIVKAFIKLSRGATPSDEIESDIQEYVKTQLAAYEYPREIEFVDELPMTITGKVKRSELE